ncbi:hypothetical protein HYO65_gp078 [Tenacibaculum phage PTm1]|uniref:Uncharacterized protein n=2 Tax=Shirahamavirus PTm1 TaxID=2846435 RepID=A0A5S9BZ05_9CAUD|nr:hypothetical protein HYO65_gp078 [Tenacibaculum phage PTm1]BBI90470.1 hypothetical protein [Tenacibaculum phage PTm1]BBI90777.1 hypothetical protein [Tenacibaculum phage PTm5]
MGCHIWFSTPLDKQPTYEEAKEFVIGEYATLIDYTKNEIELFGEDFKPYGMPNSDAKFLLKLFERQLRMIEAGYCKEAVLNKFAEFSDGVYKIENILYKTLDGIHDVFRVGGYPSDILRDYEQVLTFCKGRSVDLTAEQRETLKQFYKDYPSGIITFE